MIRNLFASVSSLFLTQPKDARGLIEATIIAAGVKFQGPAFQGGTNPFQRSVAEFNWIILVPKRQWKTYIHSIGLEVVYWSNPKMCINQSFATKSPSTSLNALPLKYFSFKPIP